MMANTFDVAIKHILEFEGGYVNDPHDPGGETNFGISKRTYPNVDIAKLTVNDAITIYRRDFWNALKLQQLPKELAVCMLDCSINQGKTGAVKMLQRSINECQSDRVAIMIDGKLGPATMNNVSMLQDRMPMLVDEFMSQRAMRYASLGNVTRYGHGWFKRLMAIHRLAISI